MLKVVHYIPVLIVLLFFSVNVTAQDNTNGDVVVHSDPRLSVLLRKKHSDVQASSVKITHRTNPASANLAEAIVAHNPGNPIGHTTAIPAVPAERPVHRWVPIHSGRIIYSGKGYRVQVYYGTDRKKAIDIKTECMRQFPGVRSYITYSSPCFRVKVGDYRNRSEAESVLREANSLYHPCMIVPDLVNVTSF
jgi:hypothetical protein